MLTYVRDPGLWPVWLVLIGHLAAGLGLLLLRALRDGRTGSAILLAALGAGSLAVVVRDSRRRGRPGPLSIQLFLAWGAGAALAWLADRYGLV